MKTVPALVILALLAACTSPSDHPDRKPATAEAAPEEEDSMWDMSKPSNMGNLALAVLTSGAF